MGTAAPVVPVPRPRQTSGVLNWVQCCSVVMTSDSDSASTTIDPVPNCLELSELKERHREGSVMTFSVPRFETKCVIKLGFILK